MSDVVNNEQILIPSFLSDESSSNPAARASCIWACQYVCQPLGECVASTQGGCSSGSVCEAGCQSVCEKNTQCSQSSTPTPPTWSLSTSKNTVTVTVSSKGDFTYFKYAILLDGSYVNITPNPTEYITATSYTFTNLSPNTKYGVYLNWSRNTAGENLGESKFITTEATTIVPVNYSNAASLTSGKPARIYASDLINFRNTIYELYDYKGITQDPFNNDLGSGVELQARHFSNFYYRIKKLGGTFREFYSGQPLSSKMLFDLRDDINAIINAL